MFTLVFNQYGFYIKERIAHLSKPICHHQLYKIKVLLLNMCPANAVLYMFKRKLMWVLFAFVLHITRIGQHI